jgi:hypothetical protein
VAQHHGRMRSIGPAALCIGTAVTMTSTALVVLLLRNWHIKETSWVCRLRPHIIIHRFIRLKPERVLMLNNLLRAVIVIKHVAIINFSTFAAGCIKLAEVDCRALLVPRSLQTPAALRIFEFIQFVRDGRSED